MKLDLNDVLIKPKTTSTINSRSEVNPYLTGNLLPLITAPMDTVVNFKNQIDFLNNGITCFLSRTDKVRANTFSLKEFKEIVNYEYPVYLIDIANGHMQELLETVKDFKTQYPGIILIVGNIANPETYKILSLAGADFIRVGIGNGGGCLTTQNTGVGYPMASLIKECYRIKKSEQKHAGIIADGGMKDYSDIIKSLALGADYVMLGSILNKCLESAGDNYFLGIKVSQSLAEFLFKRKFTIYKKYRGMSTKEVQKDWGNVNLKTSEGIVKKQKVEYTLQSWVENFTDYLKSAMSYSNARTMDEFIGKASIIEISEKSYKRFNK